MQPAIPRSVIDQAARRAVLAMTHPQTLNPWPVGTDAGRAFLREVQAQQAIQAASRRVPEGVHA